MTFRWFAALPDGTITDELTTARDRSVSWRLKAAGEAEFGLLADPAGLNLDQTSLVNPLATDLVVLWNETAEYGWRGRLGATDWAIDETTHQEKYAAVDYRGALFRRYAREPFTYTAADTTAIAWALVQHAQAGVGGSFGIGREAAFPARADTDLEVAVGKSIGETIDELAGIYPGFDWWVDADLNLRIVPFRGTRRDFPLEFPTTVSAIARRFDPSQYGNAVIQTGAEGLDASVIYAPDLADRPEGRWDLVASDPDLSSQGALDAAALGTLTRAAASGVSHTFTLRPGIWTPEALWVGDLVSYRYRSANRFVDAIERVTEITVADDGNGTPKVSITVGSALSGDLAVLDAAYRRRVILTLNKLARR